MKMNEPTLNDFFIAVARFEAKQDAMMEKLDRLEKTTDSHWKKISELESQIAVLQSHRESQSEPQKTKPWGVILAVGVSVATFVIMILDRFYVNQ